MSYCDFALTRTAQFGCGTTAGVIKAGAKNSSWLYGTDDAAATVETAGYFNNARGRLIAGDMIRAAMAVGGGTGVLKDYVVLTVPASGNVTIGLQTTTAG